MILEECPICLETCHENITISPCCKKTFHTFCYNKCLETCNNTCPTCRFIIIIENENLVEVKSSCNYYFVTCTYLIGVLIVMSFIAVIVYGITTSKPGEDWTRNGTVTL